MGQQYESPVLLLLHNTVHATHKDEVHI